MIREYRPEDTDRIIDVWFHAAAIAHPFLTDSFVEQEKINIRELYLPNSKTLVYEEDGNVNGFIGMLGNEIGGLFVWPEAQRGGIGAALIDHVLPEHDQLVVQVFKENSIGRSFYEKYGFEFDHEGVHDETGEPILHLRLNRPT